MEAVPHMEGRAVTVDTELLDTPDMDTALGWERELPGILAAILAALRRHRSDRCRRVTCRTRDRVARRARPTAIRTIRPAHRGTS